MAMRYAGNRSDAVYLFQVLGWDSRYRVGICFYLFTGNLSLTENYQSFQHVPEFADISCPLNFLEFLDGILGNV